MVVVQSNARIPWCYLHPDTRLLRTFPLTTPMETEEWWCPHCAVAGDESHVMVGPQTCLIVEDCGYVWVLAERRWKRRNEDLSGNAGQ